MILFSIDLGSKLLAINVLLRLMTVAYIFSFAWMFFSVLLTSVCEVCTESITRNSSYVLALCAH